MSNITIKKTITLPLLPIAVLATAVLGVLKLTGTIAATWWVVFSPLIALIAAFIGFVVLFALFALGFLLLMAIIDRD